MNATGKGDNTDVDGELRLQKAARARRRSPCARCWRPTRRSRRCCSAWSGRFVEKEAGATAKDYLANVKERWRRRSRETRMPVRARRRRGNADASAAGSRRRRQGGAMALELRSPSFAPTAAFRASTPARARPVAAAELDRAPAGTKSLALIVDDPDAPDPAGAARCPSPTGCSTTCRLPAGARRGRRLTAALPPGHARRHQRLQARRLRRPVSAHRPAPLLLQAVRARHRAARPRPPTKAAARASHARSRARHGRARRHVPKSEAVSSGRGAGVSPAIGQWQANRRRDAGATG